jgi:hypothetical protein
MGTSNRGLTESLSLKSFGSPSMHSPYSITSNLAGNTINFDETASREYEAFPLLNEDDSKLEISRVFSKALVSGSLLHGSETETGTGTETETEDAKVGTGGRQSAEIEMRRAVSDLENYVSGTPTQSAVLDRADSEVYPLSRVEMGYVVLSYMTRSLEVAAKRTVKSSSGQTATLTEKGDKLSDKGRGKGRDTDLNAGKSPNKETITESSEPRGLSIESAYEYSVECAPFSFSCIRSLLERLVNPFNR